jgi:hypothetical protein
MARQFYKEKKKLPTLSNIIRSRHRKTKNVKRNKATNTRRKRTQEDATQQLRARTIGSTKASKTPPRPHLK